MSAAEALDVLSIHATRTRTALSVRKLARLSGVSVRTIRRIEGGSQTATGKTLERLETVLRDHASQLEDAKVAPGSREELRDVVPWELDACAQYAVHCHPDGLSVSQIGELLDLDPRTVEVVEAVALAKLRLAKAELREWLRGHDDPLSPWLDMLQGEPSRAAESLACRTPRDDW